jgi:hypothetical protein
MYNGIQVEGIAWLHVFAHMLRVSFVTLECCVE